jgi:hypothetical protein
MAETPYDSKYLVGPSLLKVLAKANKDVTALTKLVDEFNKAEPDLSKFFTSISGSHLKMIMKRFNYTKPVPAETQQLVDNIFLKIAAMVYHATKAAIRVEDEAKLRAWFMPNPDQPFLFPDMGPTAEGAQLSEEPEDDDNG